jgi:hypothetical protein
MNYYVSDLPDTRADATETAEGSAVSSSMRVLGGSNNDQEKSKAWTAERLSDYCKVGLEKRNVVFAYNPNQWEQAARSLLEDFPHEQVVRALDYALDNDFWSVKVISMPLFKQHFATIFNQVQQTTPASTSAPLGTRRGRSADEWYRIYRDLLDPVEYPDDEVRDMANEQAEAGL